MSTLRLPPKKDVAIALLQKSSLYIHLDPRDESVRVPPWLKQRVPLVLQVGLNMAVSIPDLDVGDDALSCTLSFQRRPHFCYIPWSSVYALVGEDQRGMVWPEDVPREVAAQAQKQQQVEKRRSKLRAVPSSEPASGGAQSPASSESTDSAEGEQHAPDEHAPTVAGAAPTSEDGSAAVSGVESGDDHAADGNQLRSVTSAGQSPAATVDESRTSESGHSSPPAARRPLSIAPAPEEEGRPTEPSRPEASAQVPPTSEQSEPPEPTNKKGRSLPPYLRIVK